MSGQDAERIRAMCAQQRKELEEQNKWIAEQRCTIFLKQTQLEERRLAWELVQEDLIRLKQSLRSKRS